MVLSTNKAKNLIFLLLTAKRSRSFRHILFMLSKCSSLAKNPDFAFHFFNACSFISHALIANWQRLRTRKFNASSNGGFLLGILDNEDTKGYNVPMGISLIKRLTISGREAEALANELMGNTPPAEQGARRRDVRPGSVGANLDAQKLRRIAHGGLWERVKPQ